MTLLENFKDIVTRNDVHQFENLMKQSDEQIELPLKHHFSEGLYARELFIPAGTIVVGKIHKYENLNIMVAGEMDVLVGDKIQRVCAPFIVVSPPGTKRIAKAITDVIWLTVHATEETDLNKIENKFIAQSELEYLEFEGQSRLPFKEMENLNG